MNSSPQVLEYHAHIYFTDGMRKSAEDFHEKLGAKFGERIKRHSIAYGPRGPHVLNMFGIDFSKECFEEVVQYLMLNRGGHSILIHPVTDNELLDHTQHALWLGDKQALNLSVLV